VAIAEAKGFRLIHGIVDSMWLKKPNADAEEYQELCDQIGREVNYPIAFEGLYRWIVFLNSRTDPRIPVLNRYYGVFEDGTRKLRGIDLRRDDTPEIVRRCQMDMLAVLANAKNSNEFRMLIPESLRVLKAYATNLREGRFNVRDLVISKRLSKNPNEYTTLVPQAIAARHLVKEGGTVHAGQSVRYVLVKSSSRILENRALPAEFLEEDTPYDSEKYVELLLSSAVNLLLPFGYDLKSLRTKTR